MLGMTELLVAVARTYFKEATSVSLPLRSRGLALTRRVYKLFVRATMTNLMVKGCPFADTFSTLCPWAFTLSQSWMSAAFLSI